MDLMHIVVLGITQGITEFLPISSSTHLFLLPKILNWAYQGLFIDVALHVGTLSAVLIYFWRDVWGILKDVKNFITFKRLQKNSLFPRLFIAFVPFVIGVFIAKFFVSFDGRSFLYMGISSIVFGLLLYAADRIGAVSLTARTMSLYHAFLIGMIQLLALFPGASRLGVTVTAARLMGIKRREAMRFSFLLSIPTTLGAAAMMVLRAYKEGVFLAPKLVFPAMAISAFVGCAMLWLIMKFIDKIGLWPIALYRIVLGIVLIVMALSS